MGAHLGVPIVQMERISQLLPHTSLWSRLIRPGHADGPEGVGCTLGRQYPVQGGGCAATNLGANPTLFSHLICDQGDIGGRCVEGMHIKTLRTCAKYSINLGYFNVAVKGKTNSHQLFIQPVKQNYQ